VSARRQGQVRRMPATPYDVATEVALIVFTLAVIFGFRRLFFDGSFFVPVAAAAVSSHVLAAAVRWARGGLLISAVVSIAGLAVSASLLFPPSTIPESSGLSREVLRGFGTDLELAWDQFQTVSSPAEVTAPFLLLIAIVMWIVAFLSDWAAFRLRAPAEALLPGTAVFVFGAFFTAEEYRVISSVAVVGAALLFVLLHRLGETSRAGAWLGAGAAERGQAAMLRVGLGVLAVTLIGGVSLAQVLPGYDEPAIVDPSEWDDPEEPRVVLSPLVDIRSRLINQPDVEVFTVESELKDYWRITSLDEFDGRIWKSSGSYEEAAGELDTELPDGTQFEAVVQTFDINALGEIWLPAAYEPAEVLSKPDDVKLDYEAQSGTLIVNRETANSDGLIYSLLSAVPTRDVDAISNAGTSFPDEIGDRYLDLPDDFSELVEAEALKIVADAGAESPFEKALALQNYFRSDLFRYSLDVSKGHSSSQIEDFLFVVHAGYCEQFAGSYAAMARSLGLPARVAVGFTPGEFDPEINAYRVTGKNAHAWPEVWLEDIGWLRFEPTPGRGAPRDETYTGQPEDQEGQTPASNGPTTTVPSANPAANPVLGSPQETTTTIRPTSDRAQDGIIGGSQDVSTQVIVTWIAGIFIVLAAALFPLGYATIRSRRRHRAVAHDPGRRIGLAWSESKSALKLLGVSVRDSDTPNELVDRVANTDPKAAEVLSGLAQEVTTVTYAAGTIESSMADSAEAATATLASRAREARGGLEWWWQHASPVNVWRDKVGTWGHLRS
jgi:transglutaminase-like putative cysteine protease